MNEFIQNMTGMGAMTEQVIATDFLISAKTGVKNIASRKHLLQKCAKRLSSI
ncbi:hypothetical protein B4090_2038 [Bacillus licheniformis]|nr:hypothetical protein B4090_2038 [Bacillus licheniformis]